MMVCLTLGLCYFASESEAASAYQIRINKQKNTVTVYKYSDGEYEPYKAFVCSTGKATPLGRFRIYQKHRWRALVGHTYGQYCSRFTGPILFHSVWYQRPDPATMPNGEFNKLGTTASHGCIRLSVRDARWIYKNCSMGTPVIVYRSEDPGPLGKPESIRLPKGKGYDPTDQWSKGNPYNKKKPKITGAKNWTITYGDQAYDCLKGVRAKNTTGFRVDEKIRVSIRYRAERAGSYRKVKKVDTTKPGYYRITYRLTDELGRKAEVTVTHRVKQKPAEPVEDQPVEGQPVEAQPIEVVPSVTPPVESGTIITS
ncbi:MAG: L,D-transpeptidase family protein [Roseburia sp.]|nr:L,D-transpeptidase family protein [Roseburia sp.]